MIAECLFPRKHPEGKGLLTSESLRCFGEAPGTLENTILTLLHSRSLGKGFLKSMKCNSQSG